MTAEPPPSWNEKAQQLVGKQALIGMTCVDERGEAVEQIQLHSVVESAYAGEGIALRRDDNQELECFHRISKPSTRLSLATTASVRPEKSSSILTFSPVGRSNCRVAEQRL